MSTVFILGVIFAFVAILVKMENQKKERLFLLKQGKNPNDTCSKSPEKPTISYLKWGVIIIGIGLGLLFGALFGKDSTSIQFSFLLIFSGIGILMSYFWVNGIGKKM